MITGNPRQGTGIRIALPKGRLLQGVRDRLELAGIDLRFRNDRDYTPQVNAERMFARCGESVREVVVKLFKPRAIPQLVALGQYDFGFCGLDLIEEAGYDGVRPALDLGLNRVELVVAASRETPDIVRHPPSRPLVIATEYPNLTDAWALRHNLAHITLTTSGSTEAYCPDDADIIFDCVETGATIEANGLVIIDRILKSSTYALTAASPKPTVASAIDKLLLLMTVHAANAANAAIK